MTPLAAKTPEERARLAERWRRRAAQLEKHAQVMRRYGDTPESTDAAQAAADFYRAADELELGTYDPLRNP